jgi:GT2 family glycosyltransferase
MISGKIGIGIITCNRLDFLKNCICSISEDSYDDIVIINDGSKPITRFYGCDIINNDKNIGVGKSKNKALKYLYEKGCDYIFLIEDDTVVLDNNVFDQYINTSKETGIQHFNYGPGSPFNRKQSVQFDLHNRHELDQDSTPAPIKVIDYGKGTKVSLFHHVAGMFSFFTRRVIDEVGYIDEEYYNAWEHVDHTYRIIKSNLHPPFWYFADIYNSHEYLSEMPDAIKKSSINKDSKEWLECVSTGREVYHKKHGHYPNEATHISITNVTKILKKIKDENSHSS